MDKLFAYILRSKLCRNIVRWADRNHLTGRTRDDVFYGSNTTMFHEDTVLKCINPITRVKVRPQNIIRKILFDINHSQEPDLIRLDSNLEVRRTFRHYTHLEHMARLKEAKSAAANNHARSCVTRNAASNLLSSFKKKHGKKILLFSLSGAKLEQDAADGGFRGVFQPSDLAQDLRSDVMLQPPPEMNEYTDRPSVVIATDTLNHISEKEKNALLGNGITLVSYNPTPLINSCLLNDVKNERISFWKDKVMQTRVNGGGDYEDELWDTNYDIMVADCPDGDLMMVYVEAWLDVTDPSHAFMAEIPFCKVHRRSQLYDKMVKYPHVKRMIPLNFKVEIVPGVFNSFSMFNIKHTNLVQITNNDTRQTTYFQRSELMAVVKLEPGFKVYTCLDNEITINGGPPLDNAMRKSFIENMGLKNGVKFLKAPEINLASPLTRENIAKRIVASLISGDERANLEALQLSGMPTEIKNDVINTLGSYVGQISFRPLFNKLCSIWKTPKEEQELDIERLEQNQIVK